MSILTYHEILNFKNIFDESSSFNNFGNAACSNKRVVDALDEIYESKGWKFRIVFTILNFILNKEHILSVFVLRFPTVGKCQEHAQIETWS